MVDRIIGMEKPRGTDRRTVLRRVGGATAGLSVGAGGALFGGSDVVGADDGSCSSVTFMDQGERYTMREADSYEGCCGYTFHTDHNWGVTFVGEDGYGNYTFAATSTFHTYQEYNGESSTYPGDQVKVKLDVELNGYNDSQTNLIEEEKESGSYESESYTTLHGVGESDWMDWKKRNEGNQPSESKVKSEWNSKDYGDNGDVPDWVSHTAFAAAVGASVVSGGSLAVIAGGTATAVSAIDMVDWIGDFADDSGKDHKGPSELGNDEYYYWWDYGTRMCLTTNITRFTVSVGGDENGELNANVYQSFETGGGYEDAQGTPNCGKWRLSVPNDSGYKPGLCKGQTWLDGDGHSHPY
jgi:hypothetical protein